MGLPQSVFLFTETVTACLSNVYSGSKVSISTFTALILTSITTWYSTGKKIKAMLNLVSKLKHSQGISTTCTTSHWILLCIYHKPPIFSLSRRNHLIWELLNWKEQITLFVPSYPIFSSVCSRHDIYKVIPINVSHFCSQYFFSANPWGNIVKNQMPVGNGRVQFNSYL